MTQKIRHRERSRIFRLPPCPAYDIEGTESWLSDMAKEGWLLSQDGFFVGFAIFEKAEPTTVRYRLEPAPKKVSLWAEDGGEPSDDAKVLNAAYGWTYVAPRGQFHVYRADRSDSRELNTDPKVQAIALDMVRRRERADMVTVFFWLSIYPVLLLHGNWLLLFVQTGTWRMLWGCILILWALCSAALRVVHLRQLRGRLVQGEMPDHQKNWRQSARWYRVSGIIFLLLSVAWIAVLLHGWSDEVLDDSQLPLSTPAGQYPFATIADLSPEGIYQMEDFSTGNTVKQSSDWLAPLMLEYHETASVDLGNGRMFRGGLIVDYYETASPWLARELSRELLNEGRHERHYQAYVLPELAVDYAAGYFEFGDFPTVILCRSNRVMRATLYQTSVSYTMPFDEWARRMAESFR